MDLKRLERALEWQKEEIAMWASRRVIPRKEEALVDLESDLAQIVIGVRRSGKSTLCHEVLRKSGRTFAYANFDDERLRTLTGDDLDAVLEVLRKLYGDFECLFLDEVQNIPEWFLFVNRLLRRGVRLLVTGSNAHLLGGELATHLTGRYHRIDLFPFSYAEFCAFHAVPTEGLTAEKVAARRAAFETYLRQGGFPELLRTKSSPTDYSLRLVDDILERDIRQRYNLRRMPPFRTLASYLLEVAPTVLNYKTLATRLDMGCAPNTVRTYVDYLKQAYLLCGVRRWSPKVGQRVRNEKVYAMDVVLMNGRPDAFVGLNLGWRLETVVFLELLRRHLPRLEGIHYYQDETAEADFVVSRGRHTLAIYQVAYTLEDPRVRARELRGLRAAADATHCDNLWLITDHEEETIDLDGRTVHIVPAYDWLLAPATPND